MVGKKFDANEKAVLKDASAVADDDMIFDIGPKSAQELVDIIMQAGTVVWNGPVGVFEFDQFGAGTKTIAMAIANTKAFTLAGGGDTIAAIQKYNIYDKVSYISRPAGRSSNFLRERSCRRWRSLNSARRSKKSNNMLATEYTEVTGSCFCSVTSVANLFSEVLLARRTKLSPRLGRSPRIRRFSTS